MYNEIIYCAVGALVLALVVVLAFHRAARKSRIRSADGAWLDEAESSADAVRRRLGSGRKTVVNAKMVGDTPATKSALRESVGRSTTGNTLGRSTTGNTLGRQESAYRSTPTPTPAPDPYLDNPILNPIHPLHSAFVPAPSYDPPAPSPSYDCPSPSPSSDSGSSSCDSSSSSSSSDW